MDFALARQIYGQPWFMDALSIQKFAPILEHFKNGGNSGHTGAIANESYLISANGSDNTPLNAEISTKAEEDREEVISVLRIDGAITKHGGASHRGTRQMANVLLRNDSKDNVIGHILEIESGGGSTNAIPEMAEAIQKLNKPVVTFVDGIMASAAMYIGSYTNHIVASRETDLVGSIGTMIEFGGLPKKSEDTDGFRHVRIYADDSTNKNKEFEEAINEFNFKPIKEKILNPHNTQFKNDIKANRPNVKPIELTGEIFHANEVVGTLIDAIGPFSLAIEKVKELSNINNTAMDSKELKSKHPQVFQEAKDEGIKDERTRVKAWLAYSEIAPEAAKKGIESGAGVDAAVMAEMQVIGLKNIRLKGVESESTEEVDKGEGEDSEKTKAELELASKEAEIFAAAGIKTQES
jgi:protease-4